MQLLMVFNAQHNAYTTNVSHQQIKFETTSLDRAKKRQDRQERARKRREQMKRRQEVRADLSQYRPTHHPAASTNLP